MAPGAGGRDPRRPDAAKARTEVKSQSAGHGESEAAPRQRKACRSSAQSRDRNRCSKKSGHAAGPSVPGDGGVVSAGIGELTPIVGVKAACEALNVPRASFYRKRGLVVFPAVAATRFIPRALDTAERDAVLACLHEERFQNCAPAAVYATLLDEGRYHCSIRTMYRILEGEGEARERRDQLVHPAYQKPELLATGPNQLWSWDITKLLGPAKWTYFYLYVILDVFSRYVVGWMVADGESAELAKRLIADTCAKQEIEPGKLTIHADRGSSMTSKPVAFLMADLGITKTHSRPHVSDDNPYSESHFRTLKYRPGFPERFGSLQDSRGFSQEFFAWYNEEHRHSGLGLLSPAVVHYGLAPAAIEQRRAVLDAAYAAHPERFVRKPPQPPAVPTEVWINKPQQTPENKSQ
ncbi:MAG TPA: IS3 family transposase [Terracidiphilus sp.]